MHRAWSTVPDAVRSRHHIDLSTRKSVERGEPETRRITEARRVGQVYARVYPYGTLGPLEYSTEARKPPFTRALALLDDPSVRHFFETTQQEDAIDVARAALKAERAADEGGIAPDDLLARKRREAPSAQLSLSSCRVRCKPGNSRTNCSLASWPD